MRGTGSSTQNEIATHARTLGQGRVGLEHNLPQGLVELAEDLAACFIGLGDVKSRNQGEQPPQAAWPSLFFFGIFCRTFDLLVVGVVRAQRDDEA
jgi:hypothetical protein